MSESRRRKSRQKQFLLDHPWCCFCGGGRQSTTIDHVPARTCFKGRAFPESFEFPACLHCNDASRLDEIAFSFFIKLLDHTPGNFVDSEAEKTISGMVNNLPQLLPIPSLDGRRNRLMLNKMGLRKPSGRLYNELPMAEIPVSAYSALDRYSRKITCALFYREKGRPAPGDYKMIATWGQFLDRSFMETIRGFLTMPGLQVGTRKNINFGDQFAYRYVKVDNPDLFGFIAKFGTGLVVAGMIVQAHFADKMEQQYNAAQTENNNMWTPVTDNYKS